MAPPKLPASVRKKPSRWPWLLALVVLIAALAGVYLMWGGGQPAPELIAQKAEQAAQTASGGDAGKSADQGATPAVPAPSKHGPVVHLESADQGGAAAPDQAGGQAEEQAQRKEPYGLNKSVDAVVRSDEKIALGDREVSVAELERKLTVEQRGEVLEKSLDKKPKVSAWGVHLVRPGENLWDIHYRLLREYLASRGVKLPARADQPLPGGQSSGVGKILKFAEHMVGVYNLRTGHMSSNLNLLEPGHKVVVFNLSEIFDQLNKIDPRDLSGVMYDGRVLLFPQAGGGDKAVDAPNTGNPGN